MKKLYLMLLTIVLGLGVLFTGCSKKADESTGEAKAGNVSEAQGTEDEYGWIPHIRLTFDEKTIKEVYFDSIDGESNKKSEDSTYIDNMKDKTGMGVDEAMKNLSEQLLAKQDPDQVDVVTGATQTSNEFIALAKQAYDSYMNGDNTNNNTTIDTSETAINKDDKTKPEEGKPTSGEGGEGQSTNVDDSGNKEKQSN